MSQVTLLQIADRLPYRAEEDLYLADYYAPDYRPPIAVDCWTPFGKYYSSSSTQRDDVRNSKLAIFEVHFLKF